MKAIHYYRAAPGKKPYPLCSAGYGKGGRRSRQLFSAIHANVTCKTCQRMLAADLHDANLSNADLSGASLHGANLSGVDLSSASCAYLGGADLSGANLHVPTAPREE